MCTVCAHATFDKRRRFSGVMARAAGHDVHGDCLSCATCGSSLKNVSLERRKERKERSEIIIELQLQVGHHFIDDKFYCDVHGSQKKGLLK